jgi:uncharacterized SAM-binding protein YcdF (DUF218 family)
MRSCCAHRWRSRVRVDHHRDVEAQVTSYRSGAGAVLRRSGPALAAVAVIAGLTLAFRGAGRFLVVEGPLATAPAIVVLGGGLPAREEAAAEVFRGGWAPRVVLVPGALPEGQNDTPPDRQGVRAQDLEARRIVLERSGVPAVAIVVAGRSASNTLTELEAAAEMIRPDQQPVILVTSPYHARRVQLTWWYVTGGRSRAIVRVTRDETFDPGRWWTSRSSIDAVAHEYLGLVNALLGFRLEN